MKNFLRAIAGVFYTRLYCTERKDYPDGARVSTRCPFGGYANLHGFNGLVTVVTYSKEPDGEPYRYVVVKDGVEIEQFNASGVIYVRGQGSTYYGRFL